MNKHFEAPYNILYAAISLAGIVALSASIPSAESNSNSIKPNSSLTQIVQSTPQTTPAQDMARIEAITAEGNYRRAVQSYTAAATLLHNFQVQVLEVNGATPTQRTNIAAFREIMATQVELAEKYDHKNPGSPTLELYKDPGVAFDRVLAKDPNPDLVKRLYSQK